MKTFSLYLRKGGDGKTTITGNLGAYLASKNYKVALIDCDTQANLSMWLADDDVGEFELADVLMKKASVGEALVEVRKNLYMILTASQFSRLGNFVASELIQKPLLFSRIVTQLKELDFDYVFFDLPPNFDTLHRYVLRAIDEVIAPLQPSYFSASGLRAVTEDIGIVNEDYDSNIVVNKVIFNKLNASFTHHTKAMKEVTAMENAGYKVFYLPQDVRIEQAQAERKLLYEFSPKNKALPFIEKIGNNIIENS